MTIALIAVCVEIVLIALLFPIKLTATAHFSLANSSVNVQVKLAKVSIVRINVKLSDGLSVKINGKTVKKTKARCNPLDKFNFKIGAELAFERMFSKKLDLYHLCAGDKVRVRKDLIPYRVYGQDCFAEGMIPFLGKVVTISYAVAEGIYKIEEEKEWGYSFTAEMFENEKV